MNKKGYLKKLSLIPLCLAFSCQTATTNSNLASNALNSKAGFISFFETCVLSKSKVSEAQKQIIRTQLNLLNLVPDSAWQNSSASYKALYDQYSKYCEETGVTTNPSATPSSTLPNSFGEQSCDMEGKLKSSTGKGITVNFNNKTSTKVKIYWLDYNGKRIVYNQGLNPNDTYKQGTFITHPWLVTDSNDNCLKIYLPDGDKNIDIN